MNSGPVCETTIVPHILPFTVRTWCCRLPKNKIRQPRLNVCIHFVIISPIQSVTKINTKPKKTEFKKTNAHRAYFNKHHTYYSYFVLNLITNNNRRYKKKIRNRKRLCTELLISIPYHYKLYSTTYSIILLYMWGFFLFLHSLRSLSERYRKCVVLGTQHNTHYYYKMVKSGISFFKQNAQCVRVYAPVCGCVCIRICELMMGITTVLNSNFGVWFSCVRPFIYCADTHRNTHVIVQSINLNGCEMV